MIQRYAATLTPLTDMQGGKVLAGPFYTTVPLQNASLRIGSSTQHGGLPANLPFAWDRR